MIFSEIQIKIHFIHENSPENFISEMVEMM